MSVNCTEFIFNGISGREYGLVICSFDGSQDGTATAGSNIEFTTFKTPGSDTWLKTGATYHEQLTFSFQVCKYRCHAGDIKPFTERELAFLMRWLVRKEYGWLQFIQEGYENIFFHCQIKAERHLIGGQCCGLTLTVTCDAPFGWSQNMTATISSSASNTVCLYDSSDEIGEVCPSIEIIMGNTPDRQDITIANSLTGTSMQIDHCVPGESITIKNRQIFSSECIAVPDQHKYTGDHTTLYDDFNYQWFTIGNTFDNRENEITVTGNCTVTMNWRVPRKAVI